MKHEEKLLCDFLRTHQINLKNFWISLKDRTAFGWCPFWIRFGQFSPLELRFLPEVHEGFSVSTRRS